MSLRWATMNSFLGSFSSPALTLHRLCPVCGTMDYRIVIEFIDFQFFSDSSERPKRVSLRQNQCLKCFALFLNPCYSEFGYRVLFEEAGESYVSDGSDKRHYEQIEWMRNRGFLRDGLRAMDVGCYDGRFLALMPRNMTKIGIDIDRGAIERGKKDFASSNIEFICGDFETFWCSDPPDVITMFHVLEHLPQPLAVLRNLRRTSKSSTRLIVEVPILENGRTNDVNGFFSVQHMTHFSSSSLRNCFSQTGWRIVEWDEQSEYNGCRVVAEPGEERVLITAGAHDTVLVQEYLSAWYKALAEVELRLDAINDFKRCVIWGGGLHTEFLYQMTSFFHANPDRQYLIVDSDKMKQEKSWRGISILNPGVLSGLDWTDAKLVISSYGSQKGIKNAAIKMGIPDSAIVELYDRVRVY